jgi:hypothetical protein
MPKLIGIGRARLVPQLAGFGQAVAADTSDPVLRDISLRAFEHVWPTMRERLRAELKAERKYMIGTTVGVGVGVVAAAAAIAGLTMLINRATR